MTLAFLTMTAEARAESGAIGSHGQIAPALTLTPTGTLNFGNIAFPSPGVAGHLDIDAVTGALAGSNYLETSVTSRGSFDITGRSGLNVSLALSSPAIACQVGFTCVGAPTVTNLTHTFGTQISPANCSGVKCTETVYIGGRLVFSGVEKGKFTGDLTVTAQYQ